MDIELRPIQMKEKFSIIFGKNMTMNFHNMIKEMLMN